MYGTPGKVDKKRLWQNRQKILQKILKNHEKRLDKEVDILYNVSCVTATRRMLCKHITCEASARYAMKREVAVCVTGNFRRVCPILNRATRNTAHPCVSAYVMSCVRRVLLLCVPLRLKSYRCARPEILASIIYNRVRHFRFLMRRHETHGSVECVSQGRTPCSVIGNQLRRRF